MELVNLGFKRSVTPNEWTRGVNVTDVALLKKEAKNKKTSPSRLEELARHAELSVQFAVAGNPNTSSATLEYLGRSAKLVLLKAVAKHGNTPVIVLERLARHRQDTVRQAVAQWGQVSETLALELLNDSSESSRFLLIERSRHFPWNTLKLFQSAARDPSSLVRMVVARCANVSSVLEDLLSDADWTVVAEALGNHALPLVALTAKLESVFEQLNSGESWLNASRIVQRRDLPAHWLERFSNHPNATVRLWIAQNPNTPRETLLQLSRDRDWGVLTATASLPDLPEDVYVGYTKHREVFVRLALVANPAVPRTVLELLARDKDADIASEARKRLE